METIIFYSFVSLMLFNILQSVKRSMNKELGDKRAERMSKREQKKILNAFKITWKFNAV